MLSQNFMLFRKKPQPKTNNPQIPIKNRPGANDYELIAKGKSLEDIKEITIKEVYKGTDPYRLLIAEERGAKISIQVDMVEEEVQRGPKKTEEDKEKKQEKVNEALEAIMVQVEKQQKQKEEEEKEKETRAERQLKRRKLTPHQKKNEEARKRRKRLASYGQKEGTKINPNKVILDPNNKADIEELRKNKTNTRHKKGGQISED